MPQGPQRIVCLTEEPTEILYALGEGHRVVGISAYTVRPPEAQRDKKVVSAFLDGSLPKIQALEPDLVIGFSDIQAKLAAKLISAHLPVLIFNQRTIQEILDVIVQIGSLVGKRAKAQELVSDYLRRIDIISGRYASMDSKPRVYFEEWYDPMITGIHWVHELIEIAGGQNVFEEKCREKGAMDRVVTVEDVLAEKPDVYLASWCGAPFKTSQVLAREGFDQMPAIQAGRVYEIPPEWILQPGPACLTDGLDCIEACIHNTAASEPYRRVLHAPS